MAAALLLAACTAGVAPPDEAYVGDWRSAEMRLLITAEGMVNYERRSGSGNSRINAPIQAFEGPNFKVGIGPITTTFVVSKPPFKDGGIWKMVVDGVELRRIERGTDPLNT